MRIALYQLERPKELADDWIWIVDHTVEIGPEKCLVVLGVRVRDLPPPGECLRLEHLRPLKLFPVTHSDQHVVQAQLEDGNWRQEDIERYADDYQRPASEAP